MASDPTAASGGAASNKPGGVSYAEAAAAAGPASSQQGSSSSAPAKKRKHRGGKKRRNRRQSFAATSAMGAGDITDDGRPSLAELTGHSTSRGSSSFYRNRNSNNSTTSLESEALLDHRGQTALPPRRGSVQVPQIYQPRASQPFVRNSPSRPSQHVSGPGSGRSKLATHQQHVGDSDEEDADDHTPLMGASQRDLRSSGSYGGLSAPSSGHGRGRPSSQASHDSSKGRTAFLQHHSQTNLGDYDVNNPPSRPTSPVLGADVGFDDVMLTVDLERDRSPDERSNNRSRDVLIDIDEPPQTQQYDSNRSSPKGISEFRRRMTLKATDDVCFPSEGMSDIGDHDYMQRAEREDTRGRRRRRRWPDLGILEAWSHEEKEERTVEGMRTRKVSEPLMVGGRLRPQKRPWHREDEDAPFRFTYFNEEFENTIHSQTISELVQPGQTFRDLFIPERPILEDSSDGETDDSEDDLNHTTTRASNGNGLAGHSRPYSTRQASSRLGDVKQDSSGERTRSTTPTGSQTPRADQQDPKPSPTTKPPRYGPRPTFWLDVLSPTETEMKVLAKAFGIHPLTAEDILMQEAREKVELFKHYYFINYRSFEQDESNSEHMEPVNIYTIVFREGVISFHFSMTPHPANVRRRIRQLRDYLILSPDWISYAIIDDITDAYAPSIEKIEEEVDGIDEAILRLHSEDSDSPPSPSSNKPNKTSSSFYSTFYGEKNPSSSNNAQDGQDRDKDSGHNMLRRVGECRQRVMGLYRLLGNKADVIKGFAKRCNEQWDVAPRSEIGLYLGDIQDHIVTMTGNLTHYENLLSRAHSNYLAQINIRMNERQEKTSDILGKLTVMGTIVLPMNVVTGIWGMNCLVPGQDIETLTWFWCITAGLIVFGMSSYFIAKRVYGIV